MAQLSWCVAAGAWLPHYTLPAPDTRVRPQHRCACGCTPGGTCVLAACCEQSHTAAGHHTLYKPTQTEQIVSRTRFDVVEDLPGPVGGLKALRVRPEVVVAQRLLQRCLLGDCVLPRGLPHGRDDDARVGVGVCSKACCIMHDGVVVAGEELQPQQPAQTPQKELSGCVESSLVHRQAWANRTCRSGQRGGCNGPAAVYLPDRKAQTAAAVAGRRVRTARTGRLHQR